MFVKRSKESKPPPRPAEDAGRTEGSGPDPRDATIDRLERELAEERQAATALREALDAATFKVEVLEKSYAKQLADTRERLAATERALADKQAVLAALDGGHEDTLRALNAARAELKLLTAERDELRQRIAAGGFRQHTDAAARMPLGLQTGDGVDGGTINELISSASWTQKQSPAIGAGHASAQVPEHEAPHEEMLAPELVFTKDREDDER